MTRFGACACVCSLPLLLGAAACDGKGPTTPSLPVVQAASASSPTPSPTADPKPAAPAPTSGWLTMPYPPFAGPSEGCWTWDGTSTKLAWQFVVNATNTRHIVRFNMASHHSVDPGCAATLENRRDDVEPFAGPGSYLPHVAGVSMFAWPIQHVCGRFQVDVDAEFEDGTKLVIIFPVVNMQVRCSTPDPSPDPPVQSPPAQPPAPPVPPVEPSPTPTPPDRGGGSPPPATCPETNVGILVGGPHWFAEIVDSNTQRVIVDGLSRAAVTEFTLTSWEKAPGGAFYPQTLKGVATTMVGGSYNLSVLAPRCRVQVDLLFCGPPRSGILTADTNDQDVGPRVLAWFPQAEQFCNQ